MAPPERTSNPLPVADSSKEPSRRARWGTISRDQVVQAATKVVQDGGYQEMTIRGLASELGVAPMSLYRHVRDKDDLLDEVVDRLLAQAWQPGVQSDNWQAWLTDAADKLRHFLVSQPAARHVYLRHPVVSPAAIARMEAMLDVLRGAGLDEQAARQAYATVHTYTIGFATLEAARDGWTAADADSVGAQLAAYTTPTQFAVGLRYLIDGIERDIETTRPSQMSVSAEG
jgi:TetR/AcrR family transcriptional regulator, tetracycline repressor protein